jgi:hypothetical protein
MINFKEVEGFWNEHKGKIIIGILGVAGAIAFVMDGTNKKKDDVTLELKEEKPFDPGRELDMIFVTKDGETLGKIGCYESYMDSFDLAEYGEDYRPIKED